MKGNFSKGSAAPTGSYSGFFKHSGPSGGTLLSDQGKAEVFLLGSVVSSRDISLFLPGKSICIHPNREEQTREIILPKSSLTQRGPLIRARVRGDVWMTHRQLHHQNAHNSVSESYMQGSYLHGPPNRVLSLSNCLLLA